MIEKLTEEQEKQLVAFREECLRIGLNTDALSSKNKETISAIVGDIYSKYLGINKKPYVWYVEDPVVFNLVLSFLGMKGNLGANLRDNLGANLRDNLRANLWTNLRANLGDNLRANLGDNLRDNLWANLGANLGDNLRANLWANLRDNLEANLRDNLWANLEANLGANLRDNLRDNLWANLRANLWANLQNIYWSNSDICWLSFYVFPEKYLGIKYGKESKDLKLFYDFFSNTGFVWFFKDICFVSERLKKIKKKGIQLHCDTGPAIEMRSGYRIYYLNGVSVPSWLVETQAEKIDCKNIMTEKNAEVRREIVRKVGVERMIVKLGAKSLDKSPDGVYELLGIDIGDNRVRPYLKMKNPSIQTWHVEGVAPECQTVEQALNWRNQTTVRPSQLS